jgi:hypothetical protein
MNKYTLLSYVILIVVIIDCVYIYYDSGTFNSLYIGSVLILSGLVDKLARTKPINIEHKET